MKDIYVVSCVQPSAMHFYVARAFTSEARARAYAAGSHGLRVDCVVFDESESGAIFRGDLGAVLSPDTLATLVDRARANAEADFRELALMSGVARTQLDALWTSTRHRLGSQSTGLASSGPETSLSCQVCGEPFIERRNVRAGDEPSVVSHAACVRRGSV
jgi:hypothetical protein